MKEKKFIRFICNTKDHPAGEKIKARGYVTKCYDDNDVFLYDKKPYLFAQANQFIVDIDFIFDGVVVDYRQYSPLHHFKHDNGNIVKKTTTEITAIEAQITAIKEQKAAERVVIEQDKIDNEKILKDTTKTDKERLDALAKLYK